MYITYDHMIKNNCHMGYLWTNHDAMIPLTLPFFLDSKLDCPEKQMTTNDSSSQAAITLWLCQKNPSTSSPSIFADFFRVSNASAKIHRSSKKTSWIKVFRARSPQDATLLCLRLCSRSRLELIAGRKTLGRLGPLSLKESSWAGKHPFRVVCRCYRLMPIFAQFGWECWGVKRQR